MAGWGKRKRRSMARHFLAAFGLAALLTVGAWYLLGGGRAPLTWLAAWLAGVNLTAFGYYGYDKWRARRGSNRIPELVLHALTVAGGGPGAYAGMHWFRHKTVKGSFRILFWLILALQAALVLWVLKLYWPGGGTG